MAKVALVALAAKEKVLEVKVKEKAIDCSKNNSVWMMLKMKTTLQKAQEEKKGQWASPANFSAHQSTIVTTESST